MRAKVGACENDEDGGATPLPSRMKGLAMKRLTMTVVACACAFALALGVLGGCSPNAANPTDEQKANRAYMSQVNSIMTQLGDDLDSFVDAVSRGDVVNMRTQADNAYKELDQLANVEAPEPLAEVQKQYVDGTAKMREALDEYITLYTEASSESFDQSTYDDRVAEVQKLYDEGVEMLKAADEAAASK